MINAQDEKWHDCYENSLSNVERSAVDSAYRAAVVVLKAEGIPIANDDRAECLVAAITRFVVESRKNA